MEKENIHNYSLELSLDQISYYIAQGNKDSLQDYLNILIYFLPEEVKSLSIPFHIGDEELKVVATRGIDENEIEQGENWGFTDLIRYTLQENLDLNEGD